MPHGYSDHQHLVRAVNLGAGAATRAAGRAVVPPGSERHRWGQIGVVHPVAKRLHPVAPIQVLKGFAGLSVAVGRETRHHFTPVGHATCWTDHPMTADPEIDDLGLGLSPAPQ